MDELDRLLAETLRGADDRAPTDAGLLDTVHRRSRRYHRRRIATRLTAAAAVLAVGLPALSVLTTGPDPVGPPLDVVPPVTAPPVTPTPTPPPATTSARPERTTPAPSATGSTPPRGTVPATRAVTLTDGWSAPRFPYTLPAAAHRQTPVASMSDGDLVGFFETTDWHEADVTVTVSARRPTFPAGSAASEQEIRVRGQAGTLRTVDVRPAKQLTLYWRESSNRWIQLATDDTYTPAEVVALAESLSAASIAVLPPFELARSPADLVTDTVTRSRMTFRAPGSAPGTDGLSTVLRERRQLTGVNQRVNGDDAVLTRRDGRVTLAVDVTNWQATLEITVGNGLTISDADLLRYATGVRILDRSDPE
ncbi:hypothetical protein ACN28G_02470 [Micromonospora sp. WMMA1923]|uniref:hypothetical protein n=1 Tax=Micromonospora sp. WMMA1923 TaxID=3404125 RepID=UPI003B946000